MYATIELNGTIFYVFYRVNISLMMDQCSIIIQKMVKERTVILMMLSLLCLVEVAFSNNVLINHNFSSISLSKYYSGSFFGIDGWQCNIECQLLQCYYYTIFRSTICEDSTLRYERITQLVQLKGGKSILQVLFYLPYSNNQTKSLLIYFNTVLVHNHSTTGKLKTPLTLQNITFSLQSQPGLNNLSITMSGSNNPDSYGFLLKDISIEQASIPRISKITNLLFDNTLLQTYITIPAYRIFFDNFLMLFTHLDRFQLYLAHHRNYSSESLFFLQKVNELKARENNLITNQLFKAGVIQNDQDQLQKLLNSKANYYKDSMQFSAQRNKFAEFQSIVEERDFFLYTTPSIVAVYLLLNILFRISRNQPFSLLIRKYQFGGMLLVMIFQGKIQSLSYYLTGQFMMLFSLNMKNKLFSTAVNLLFFIIIFVSVSSLTIFKFHYKRAFRYFLINRQSSKAKLFSATFERGIICVLFGIVHRVFLSQPDIQLLVLMILECIWMIQRIIFSKYDIQSSVLLTKTWIIQGISRIIFQITIYLYGRYPEMRVSINHFHYYLLFCYSILILLEIITNLAQFLVDLKKVIIKIIRFNRIKAEQQPSIIEYKPQKPEQHLQLPNQLKNNLKEQDYPILSPTNHCKTQIQEKKKAETTRPNESHPQQPFKLIKIKKCPQINKSTLLICKNDQQPN